MEKLTKDNCIFFLGGYDLEMLEIKKLLEEKGFVVVDNELSWGAKLSDYASHFSSEKYNVCIELAEDISPPEKYLRIDHHNELAILPASIEQIAEILNIELIHFQKLVAENDKGFIPALKTLGATKEEIKEIRFLDRKAQGVTQEMEDGADEAIKKAKFYNNLVVIESKFSRFSPITDRVDFENYLVFFEDEATYYGNKVENLKTLFKNEIYENLVYFGKSFFGFPKGFNEQILFKLIKIFI